MCGIHRDTIGRALRDGRLDPAYVVHGQGPHPRFLLQPEGMPHLRDYLSGIINWTGPITPRSLKRFTVTDDQALPVPRRR